MSMSIRSVALIVALAGGAIASTASATVIATFSYDDLAGTYTQASPGVGSFSAVAVDQGPGGLRSWGTTSRLVSPTGDASFQNGFVTQGTANMVVNVSVNVINATPGNEFGLGVGSVVVTDADGDTITADLNGFWTATPNSQGLFLNFNGSMSNVFLNDNGLGDGTFDGTAAGAWNMGLPGGPPYSGALVHLVFGAQNFFQTGFADRATGVTGQIIPTPGALALLGLGGIVAGRRRR